MSQSTEKTFKICGVSYKDGLYKVRHATDPSRIKVLEKTGHIEIKLVELSQPMTKLEAAKFIKDLPEFQYTEAQQAIGDFLTKEDIKAEKLAPKPPKEPKAAKPAKAPKEPKAAKPAKGSVEIKPAATGETEAVDFATAMAEDAALATADENEPF
jgi:hypothetical protein